MKYFLFFNFQSIFCNLFSIKQLLPLSPRYVESTPKWAKQLEGEMKLGRHVLSFRAKSPFSNQTASCQMVIHVKDTEPPRVESCPNSFVDYLRPGQKMKRVTWREPIFKVTNGSPDMTS